MNIKALAEAVILQSLEDLWNAAHRSESIEFFSGEGFDYYAGIAGLGAREKEELLSIFGAHMEELKLMAAEQTEVFTGDPK
ncbi:MAG: hypothetical protein M0Z61_17725 [Nitrospiraceae bacterium]|nr:hypothetical protein [Nitrospiraceae bacterium]